MSQRPTKKPTTSPAGPCPQVVALKPKAAPSPTPTPTPTPLYDPAATLIRMPELLAITGLQRATVYKRLKSDPTFPRPVPLSDSTARGAPVAWVLAEVQTWVKARIAARKEVAA